MRHILIKFAPWLCFLAMLAWRWQTELFTHLPSYGDVLEVIWGMQWYADALTQTAYPVYTPLLFHPNGWYIASFGYTPTILLALVPLYWLGGAAFAYNMACLLSFGVVFAGSLRLVRLYAPVWVATAAALVVTFAGYRWLRIYGHINILWATSLLPWLLWSLEKTRRELADPTDPPRRPWRSILLTGGLWGALIHCNLYSLFWGGLGFLLWGRRLWTRRGLRQAALSAGLALVVSAPLFVLYVQGTRHNHFPPPSPLITFEWGASLNSLVLPPHFHPQPMLMAFARSVYRGPYDESGVFNLGVITILAATVGIYYSCRPSTVMLRDEASHPARGLLWLAGISLILSLGWVARWNGAAVSHPSLAGLNTALWQLGHWLKPDAFASLTPPPPFDTGLALPGMLLAMVVPFMEAARVTARYAFLTGLALAILAALGLRALPRWLAVPLALLWVAEMVPPQTGNVPFPTPPHPAYAWLAQQPLDPGEGIVDLILPSYVMTGGEAAYATTLHGRPTANGIGSFWPEHTGLLGDRLKHGGGLASPEISPLLHQLGIRYVLVHLRGDQERHLWQQAQTNPDLAPHACWEPASRPSPWPHPICIAEVRLALPAIDLIRTEGWSNPEAWGVWAEGRSSRAKWVATTRDDYRLIFEGQPICMVDQQQRITIEVNGVRLDGSTWRDCNARQETITIPGSVVQLGWNELRFSYRYAARPVDVSAGVNPDRRSLAIGFSQLRVERVK